jgi:hypothetical protein
VFPSTVLLPLLPETLSSPPATALRESRYQEPLRLQLRLLEPVKYRVLYSLFLPQSAGLGGLLEDSPKERRRSEGSNENSPKRVIYEDLKANVPPSDLVGALRESRYQEPPSLAAAPTGTGQIRPRPVYIVGRTVEALTLEVEKTRACLAHGNENGGSWSQVPG